MSTVEYGVKIVNWDKNPMELDIYASIPNLTSTAWLQTSVPGCKNPDIQLQQSEIRWPVSYSVSHASQQVVKGAGGGKIVYKQTTACKAKFKGTYNLVKSGSNVSVEESDEPSELQLAGNQLAVANRSSLGTQSVGISMNGKLLGVTDLECSEDDTLVVTLTPVYFWRVAQRGLIQGEQISADLLSKDRKIQFLQGNRYITITIYMDANSTVQKAVQYGTDDFPNGLDAHGSPL